MLIDYGIVSVSIWGEVVSKNKSLKTTVNFNGEGKAVEVITVYDPIKRRGTYLTLARVVWAWHNGSISSDEYVRHKDGSSFNNSINNLFISKTSRGN